MEFCLLGPLLVRRGGVVVAVSPGRQRALLAALLLSGNRVVMADELAEALWGSAPPASARASLQTHVMRLRKSLADAGPCRITSQPGGYLISLRPGELDVERFESSLAAARQAARSGSHAASAGRLRAALSLWRGQPLAGVPSEALVVREAPRLAQHRPAATDTNTSGSTASVHPAGSEYCRPSQSRKNTRSSDQIWRTATKTNSRPHQGWNG